MDLTSKNLLKKILGYLVQFDIVIFDLDNTLLNINLQQLAFLNLQDIYNRSKKDDFTKYVNNYNFIRILLINLQRLGKTVIILTHSERNIVRAFIESVNLQFYFDYIISARIRGRLIKKSLFITDINNEWTIKYNRLPYIINISNK